MQFSASTSGVLRYCRPRTLSRALSRPISRLSSHSTPTLAPRTAHPGLQISVSTSTFVKTSPSFQTYSKIARRYSSTRTSLMTATEPTCVTQSQSPGDATVYSFFEDATSTWQYIVVDPATKKAVIIDPVLDYNPASGAITTETADGLLAFVKERGLDVIMLLETHAHADHLTSAQYLKQKLGGNVPVGIGKRIVGVQKRFADVYGVEKERYEGAFDKLWEDDEKFKIGELECQIVHLPGHTPDHVGYQVGGKALFLGDTLFYPDVGSARADFPGGSPEDLYNSIERVLSLSPDTRIYAGHDYPPEGAGQPKDRCWSFVSEQREKNVHLTSKLGDIPNLAINSAEEKPEDVMNRFIQWRAKRDKSLGAPRLIHPSLQVNICAGRLPGRDENGRRMMKIPLKVPEGL
ncbi:metallo-beta-lactamase [Coprinopsis cinerea okayama7|uniref:Metallo-beta-lactamase n=1 Tax=Coprinopsis cinerea (strain Okayama-7 / 130 / ATCC MYA-4618 / FGSC 9003) TaxID=240176 RepID=A8PB30_COPC7|nr:metallo-beta-lactamase [Coprinopsis cinerea okayama7\|eukprot:XP_001840097.2 metallo-beta-lactamase [Coprinopsis cinerea okayama7\